MNSPTSTQSAGLKRAHEPDEAAITDTPTDSIKHRIETPQAHPSSAALIATFRNVSACNRCRVRKNKCDQRLPACTSCEKAHTRCVGFDPITKKEIPRSYVYFLETRMQYLESLLSDNNVPFKDADAFEDDLNLVQQGQHSHSDGLGRADAQEVVKASAASHNQGDTATSDRDDEKINKIVSEIGMVSVHGASDRRYLGATSGISFARVVLAAIKSSNPGGGVDDNGSRKGKSAEKPAVSISKGSSMRDSYFGLSIKPTITEAPFPDRDLGQKLVNLYFEHANPQIPILHRVEFMNLVDRLYTTDVGHHTSKELYFLNMVFAIGAGVIFGSSDNDASPDEDAKVSTKRARLSSQQAQPEEYHASAIVHLNSFFTTNSADPSMRAGGDLEDLQAVLLLAGFALLRPVAPGLWYIVGVAMRLAIDLGLHFEDGSDVTNTSDESHKASLQHPMTNERGRREWMLDMRRRLWWCTYCFDRLVSTCVGRPFGITDTIVTTEFPSLLDDRHITRAGILQAQTPMEPSYKHVAYHYLRLRLLQSEILQVLQYQQAQQARAQGTNADNAYLHKDVPSPFLVKHKDFRSWRSDVDQRLWEWKESAPHPTNTGVAFSIQFLELNYWQAVIMLYRNSLSVPEPLAGELSPTAEVSTPTSPLAEDKDDQDLVFLKCAEAGQKTLKLYRQLHRRKLVNYTYLATHHLFMAGISFLYAVWHSPMVRSRLSLDDFDFTVLAATSVLGDLMEKCPPAKACRDAFERMSKATVQMCMNTPGYRLGQGSDYAPTSHSTPQMVTDTMAIDTAFQELPQKSISRRPPPQFDMDLHELFPEDLDSVTKPSNVLSRTRNHHAHKLRHAAQHYSHQKPGGHSSGRRHRPSISSGGFQATKRSSSFDSPTYQQQHQQQQQQQQQQQPSMSPHSPTSMMSSAPSYFNMHPNSYNPDFMSNMPGMEFLSNLGANSAVSGSSNRQHQQHHIQQQQQQQPTASPPPPEASTSPAPIQTGFDFMSGGSPLSFDGLDYQGDQAVMMPPGEFDFDVGVGFDFNPQGNWANAQHGFDLDGFFFGGNGT